MTAIDLCTSLLETMADGAPMKQKPETLDLAVVALTNEGDEVGTPTPSHLWPCNSSNSLVQTSSADCWPSATTSSPELPPANKNTFQLENNGGKLIFTATPPTAGHEAPLQTSVGLSQPSTTSYQWLEAIGEEEEIYFLQNLGLKLFRPSTASTAVVPPWGASDHLLSWNPAQSPSLDGLYKPRDRTLVELGNGLGFEGFGGIFVNMGFSSRNGFPSMQLSWSGLEKSIDPSLTQFRVREVQLRSDYKNDYFILIPDLHGFQSSCPEAWKSTQPRHARLDEPHVCEIRVRFEFKANIWENSSQRGILTKILRMQLTRPPEPDQSHLEDKVCGSVVE